MREITLHQVEGGPPTVSVFAEDELGPGGAPHHYEIRLPGESINVVAQQYGESTVWIDFQKGGVTETGGINGVTHEALLAIVVDRLEHFQAGPYPSKDNAEALFYAHQALRYLQNRTRERIARGVEGKSAS